MFIRPMPVWNTQLHRTALRRLAAVQLLGALPVPFEDPGIGAGTTAALEPVEHLCGRPRDEVPGGTWSSCRPLGKVVSSCRYGASHDVIGSNLARDPVDDFCRGTDFGPRHKNHLRNPKDIVDADAAYGTVPPELLARATKLRWDLRRPQPGSMEWFEAQEENKG
jgi:hypothetical protein